MKVGVATHPKFLRLVRHLRKSGCIGEVSPNLIAIGLLEGLWNLTAQHCKRGDIGKMDNVDIAEGLHWHGNEDDLVGYLVDSGWIDECEDDRLVIHDWAEHCPTFVKGVISRSNENFTKSATKLATKSKTKLPTKSATIVPNQVSDSDELSTQLPSQAYPSLVKSSQSKPSQELSIVPSVEGEKNKKTTAQINRELEEDFERFWKSTPYPKRKPSQDGKGAILKKYLMLRRNGTSYEDIAEACELFAASNPAGEFTMGLKAFMEKANIEQWLDGDTVGGYDKGANEKAVLDRLFGKTDPEDEEQKRINELGMAIMRGKA